jgi:hypothetical protein
MAMREDANKKKGKNLRLYQLQVLDAWDGDYWLQLEIRGDAWLYDLDRYLRDIWLECCGHLSGFKIGADFYTQLFEDALMVGDEKPMDKKIQQLFQPGMEVPYEYDFGSTTSLVIKVVSEREGKPLTPNPIALMARNLAPEFSCQECGQPATYFCIECMVKHDWQGTLCDQHEEMHHHRLNYGEPMPIVNSPRVGVCGYVGPAEPPY